MDPFIPENITLDRDLLLMGVRSVLNNEQKGFYLIAEIEGHPAACLMITKEWSDWRNRWWWWFQSVYVSKPYRRLKIFSKMYKHIIDLGKHENIAGLRLYVDNHNLKAQSTYKALGINQSNYNMYEVEL